MASRGYGRRRDEYDTPDINDNARIFEIHNGDCVVAVPMCDGSSR